MRLCPCSEGMAATASHPIGFPQHVAANRYVLVYDDLAQKLAFRREAVRVGKEAGVMANTTSANASTRRSRPSLTRRRWQRRN
jgi:hypothetical protein